MGLYKKKWPEVFTGSWICEESFSKKYELKNDEESNLKFHHGFNEIGEIKNKTTKESNFDSNAFTSESISESVILYKYLIKFLNFEPSIVSEKTSSSSSSFSSLDYILLVSKQFCSDKIPLIQLYLPHGEKVKANVQFCGSELLSSDQLKLAKAYHGWITNMMKEGLNIHTNSTHQHKYSNLTFLHSLENGPEFDSYKWEFNRAYLLLPAKRNSFSLKLTEFESSSPASDSSNEVNRCLNEQNSTENEEMQCLEESFIDWNSINDAISSQMNMHSLEKYFTPLPSVEISNSNADDNTHLVLCNGRFPIEHLMNAVIQTVHYKAHYLFVQKSTLTSLSTFTKNGITMSYFDYYVSKHGITLKHPEQNLINLRCVPNTSNMLSLRGSKEGSKKVSKLRLLSFPPELCEFVHKISQSNYLTILRLPSIMHMLQCQLIIIELMKNINAGDISPAKLLEAVTPSVCLMEYNYERMELIGDSFLKYAVAKHVFFTIPEPLDGILSGVLQDLTRNKLLYNLALSRKLPEYMHAEKFDPLNWVAPGRLKSKKERETELIMSKMEEKITVNKAESNEKYRNPTLISTSTSTSTSTSNANVNEENEVQFSNLNSKENQSCEVDPMNGRRGNHGSMNSQCNEEGTEKEKEKEKEEEEKKKEKMEQEMEHENEMQCISDWMISDSVEALLGTYLEEGGELSAMAFLDWIGLTLNHLPSHFLLNSRTCFDPSEPKNGPCRVHREPVMYRKRWKGPKIRRWEVNMNMESNDDHLISNFKEDDNGDVDDGVGNSNKDDHDGIGYGVKSGVKEDVNDGVNEKDYGKDNGDDHNAVDIKNDVKDDLKGGVKDDMKDDMKDDVKDDVNDDVNDDIKYDVKGDVKDDVNINSSNYEQNQNQNQNDLMQSFREHVEHITVSESDFEYDTFKNCSKMLINNAYSKHVLPKIAFHKNLHASRKDMRLRREMIKNEREIKEIEDKIGYKFKEKRLLIEAFIHTSCDAGVSWCCFERLNFLGEGIVDYVVTCHLAKSYPQSDPGKLTELRQAARNNEKLSRSFLSRNLHRHLRIKSKELMLQILAFDDTEKSIKKGESNISIHNNNNDDNDKEDYACSESRNGLMSMNGNACACTCTCTCDCACVNRRCHGLSPISKKNTTVHGCDNDRRNSNGVDSDNTVEMKGIRCTERFEEEENVGGEGERDEGEGEEKIYCINDGDCFMDNMTGSEMLPMADAGSSHILSIPADIKPNLGSLTRTELQSGSPTCTKTQNLDLGGSELKFVKKEAEKTNHWFGNSAVSAPKVLNFAFHSLTAAIYLDCDFDLDVVWEICKNLLQPLPQPENVLSHPMKILTEFCHKNQLKLDVQTSKTSHGSFLTRIKTKVGLVAECENKDSVTSRRLAAYTALEKCTLF